MWPNAQKLMTDSWSVTTGPLVWANEDKVRTWEAWVQETLNRQREWSQTLAARASEWPGLPKPMGALLEQTQAVNGQFLALQSELWSRWFELLKQPTRETANEAAPRKPVEVAPVETAPAISAPVEAAPVEVPAVRELETEDDLTAIAGVGPAIEGKLKAAGIRTYRDIAAWSEADIARIEASVLGGRFVGRIRRDDWVEQARWLHAEKYRRAV